MLTTTHRWAWPKQLRRGYYKEEEHVLESSRMNIVGEYSPTILLVGTISHRISTRNLGIRAQKRTHFIYVSETHARYHAHAADRAATGRLAASAQYPPPSPSRQPLSLRALTLWPRYIVCIRRTSSRKPPVRLAMNTLSCFVSYRQRGVGGGGRI